YSCRIRPSHKVIRRRRTLVVDDVIVKMIGTHTGNVRFLDDYWRKYRIYIERIIIDVSAGERIIDSDEVSFVILADIITDDDIVIPFIRNKPHQAMGIIMAVTILPYCSRTSHIRIIQTTIRSGRSVQISFIVLK